MANGDVYQKVAGVWTLEGNIAGPAGPSGLTWYEGTGAPGGGTGADGDLYIDVTSGASSAAGMVMLSRQLLLVDTATVTFSSISNAYSSLLLTIMARSSRAVAVSDTLLRFNGDSGSNYDTQYVEGQGTTASSASTFATTGLPVALLPGTSATRSTMAGCGEVLIPGYALATFEKITVGKDGVIQGTATTNANAIARTGQWRNTTPVTQIDLTQASGNFLAGSLFVLYGMA